MMLPNEQFLELAPLQAMTFGQDMFRGMLARTPSWTRDPTFTMAMAPSTVQQYLARQAPVAFGGQAWMPPAPPSQAIQQLANLAYWQASHAPSLHETARPRTPYQARQMAEERRKMMARGMRMGLDPEQALAWAGQVNPALFSDVPFYFQPTQAAAMRLAGFQAAQQALPTLYSQIGAAVPAEYGYLAAARQSAPASATRAYRRRG